MGRILVMDHDVIVTGATGKIGRALCDHLERQGRKVMKVSRSLGWDLTKWDEVHMLFQEHRSKYLVNCFAKNDHVREGHVTNLGDIEFRDYMEVNVTALYNVCREWAMANQREGSDRGIVNFSSIYGVVAPDPDCYSGMGAKSPGYCVSKAAVIGLTRYLAAHLASVRVNCIVLGAIYDPTMPDEFVKRMADRHPTNIFGEAHEVRGLVDLLCSNRSAFMTGSVITLDGGYTLT
jgi:gluconate 5-dehydrogenase